MNPNKWNKQDMQAANAEGWSLYDCSGSLDGRWQVQRNDENPLLGDDIEAWKLVAKGTKPIHSKVMAILLHNNISECVRIARHKFSHDPA